MAPKTKMSLSLSLLTPTVKIVISAAILLAIVLLVCMLWKRFAVVEHATRQKPSIAGTLYFYMDSNTGNKHYKEYKDALKWALGGKALPKNIKTVSALSKGNPDERTYWNRRGNDVTVSKTTPYIKFTTFTDSIRGKEIDHITYLGTSYKNDKLGDWIKSAFSKVDR